MITGACIYLKLLYSQPVFSTSFLVFLAIAAELTLIFFNTWNVIRQCLFALHTMLLFALATRSHLAEMDRLVNCGFQKTFLKMLKQYQMVVAFYRPEYQKLLAFARQVDLQVSSGTILCLFISNLGLNLVLIAELLFRPALTTSDKVLMMLMVSFQMVLMLFLNLGLIVWSDCFTSKPERLLYRVQLCGLVVCKLTAENQMRFLYKRALMVPATLKLAFFYEQVCSRKAFRFTVGHLGKISQHTLAEFALLYSSLVMYVAKMVKKRTL